MGNVTTTVTVPFENGEPKYDFKSYNIEDGQLIVLRSTEPLPPERKQLIQDTMTDKIKKTYGFENIQVLVVDTTKSVDVITLKDRDILALQLTDRYFSETNAQYMVESVRNIFDEIDLDKKVGILVVKEPADVSIMDDDALLGLGLVKMNLLVENLSEKEYKKIMKKMGFEEAKPFDEVKKGNDAIKEDDIADKKYIVHDNEEIGFRDMIKLYGAEPLECVSVHSPLLKGENVDNYYHLYPRLDNKWELPNKKGR